MEMMSSRIIPKRPDIWCTILWNLKYPDLILPCDRSLRAFLQSMSNYSLFSLQGHVYILYIYISMSPPLFLKWRTQNPDPEGTCHLANEDGFAGFVWSLRHLEMPGVLRVMLHGNLRTPPIDSADGWITLGQTKIDVENRHFDKWAMFHIYVSLP